jgi:hypothetical protein
MTSSEIKQFRKLPPEEKENIIRELQMLLSSKRDDFQTINKRVINIERTGENLQVLDPLVAHMKIIHAELIDGESNLSKMKSFFVDESDSDFNDDDEGENEVEEETKRKTELAIAKTIVGNGVTFARVDISRFQPIKEALTYKEILEKDGHKSEYHRREEIQRIVREYLNASHK